MPSGSSLFLLHLDCKRTLVHSHVDGYYQIVVVFVHAATYA